MIKPYKYALFGAGALFAYILWKKRPKSGGFSGAEYPGPPGTPAIRNNNPFNLIKTGTQWQGKVTADYPDNDRFEKFQSYYYGFRAGLKNVKTQYDRGYNSIEKLISRLTPPEKTGGDNPDKSVDDFIHDVAEKMGHNIKSVFPWTKDNVKALAKVIVDTEAGTPNFSQTEFEKVWPNV